MRVNKKELYKMEQDKAEGAQKICASLLNEKLSAAPRSQLLFSGAFFISVRHVGRLSAGRHLLCIYGAGIGQKGVIMLTNTEDKLRLEREMAFCKAIRNANVKCGDFVTYQDKGYRVIGMYTTDEAPYICFTPIETTQELRIYEN